MLDIAVVPVTASFIRPLVCWPNSCKLKRKVLALETPALEDPGACCRALPGSSPGRAEATAPASFILFWRS